MLLIKRFGFKKFENVCTYHASFREFEKLSANKAFSCFADLIIGLRNFLETPEDLEKMVTKILDV